jgi:hypothetical protein
MNYAKEAYFLAFASCFLLGSILGSGTYIYPTSSFNMISQPSDFPDFILFHDLASPLINFRKFSVLQNVIINGGEGPIE